ncbi:MAG: hypothetical protein NUW37_02080 [Planctomycetes bacterium]|nr:hypothetical protein [Planctomycetota bacterium]
MQGPDNSASGESKYRRVPVNEMRSVILLVILALMVGGGTIGVLKWISSETSTPYEEKEINPFEASEEFTFGIEDDSDDPSGIPGAIRPEEQVRWLKENTIPAFEFEPWFVQYQLEMPAGDWLSGEDRTVTRKYLKNAYFLEDELLERITVPKNHFLLSKFKDDIHARIGRVFYVDGILWEFHKVVLDNPEVAELERPIPAEVLAMDPDEVNRYWQERGIERKVTNSGTEILTDEDHAIDHFYEGLIAYSDGRQPLFVQFRVLEIPEGTAPLDFVAIRGMYSKVQKYPHEIRELSDQSSFIPPRLYARTLANDAQEGEFATIMKDPRINKESLGWALQWVKDQYPYERYNLEATGHDFLLAAMANEDQAKLAELAKSSQDISYIDLLNRPYDYRGMIRKYRGTILRVSKISRPPNIAGVTQMWECQIGVGEGEIVTVHFTDEPPRGLVSHQTMVETTGAFLKIYRYDAPLAPAGFNDTPIVLAKSIAITEGALGAGGTRTDDNVYVFALIIALMIFIPLVVVYAIREGRKSEKFMVGFAARRSKYHIKQHGGVDAFNMALKKMKEKAKTGHDALSTQTYDKPYVTTSHFPPSDPTDIPESSGAPLATSPAPEAPSSSDPDALSRQSDQEFTPNSIHQIAAPPSLDEDGESGNSDEQKN